MAWAIDEDEPRTLMYSLQDLRHDVDPLRHVREGGVVIAHNAAFELAIWNNIMVPRYGWPVLKPEQTYCTMAMCYAMALPGALEDAALALGLAVLKDTEGRALMLRMARPRSTNPDGTHVWWDEPEKLARLYAYCQQDVRVERELGKRLLPLSERERQVWLMDYAINQRGVAVDLETAKAAMAMAEIVKERCTDEIVQITHGAVQSITAVAAFKEWIRAQGVVVDSLAKQDVIDLLDTAALPENVRRALTLRQEAGKASTAKLDRLVDSAGDDACLRNLYQYHGAGPGRWAGRGVQVHNLPRDMPARATVERILSLVRTGDYVSIDAVFGPPLTMISKCLRSFFVAPPGKMLISGDWANVESRGAAWFAGENWKLEAFRKQDAKTGPDVYCIGAGKLLGIRPEAVNKDQRQSYGKVPDLAFQYQGGIGSGKVMGKTYGVKATDAEWDARKHAWRAAHPAITAIWPRIQRAAIHAVQNPGTPCMVGHTGREATFEKMGSFLRCLLPSGRAIWFPYPKILEGEFGPQLTYMAVPGPDKSEIIYDVKNASNWARFSTYGGALFNRIVQGFCRDFLADGMLALDAAGASIVLHTHDSINIEVAESKAVGARVGMERIMIATPAWAAGFPLFSECEIETRHRG